MTSAIDGFVDQSDLRSNAVGRLREKKQRARYRRVDAAALGRPKDEWSWQEDSASVTPKRRELLNKRELLRQNRPYRHRSCCDYCLNNRVNLSMRAPRNSKYDEEIAMAHEEPERRCPVCEDEDQALAGVTFSYDQPRGPTYGSQILAQALNLAVTRFEANELDKLVKSEYDVVQAEDSTSEDDEFELV